jgi:hypothetical protein
LSRATQITITRCSKRSGPEDVIRIIQFGSGKTRRA